MHYCLCAYLGLVIYLIAHLSVVSFFYSLSFAFAFSPSVSFFGVMESWMGEMAEWNGMEHASYRPV